MKKGGVILLVGLLASAAVFAGAYYLGTAPCRGLMQKSNPELAWLQKEFHLSDAEFARIAEMHGAYLPTCQERCRRIEEQNQQLRQLLDRATTVTPEIERMLAERANTRSECEAEMLKHFLAVSRMMPAEQGRRYLEWVETHCSLMGQNMEQQHHTGAMHHE